MDFASYQCIEFHRDGRILTVTLNRPDQRNAVNARLHHELSRVFTDVQRDPDSDVVVLTGNGTAFCAGGDIDWMQLSIDEPEEFEKTAREAKDIVYSQLDLEKPLICKLNGHATGLGASLALLCDIIVASDEAKIGDPLPRFFGSVGVIRDRIIRDQPGTMPEKLLDRDLALPMIVVRRKKCSQPIVQVQDVLFDQFHDRHRCRQGLRE